LDTASIVLLSLFGLFLLVKLFGYLGRLGIKQVTARELAKALRVPEKRIVLELRRMQARGLVEMDILPDTIFVRCLVKVRHPPAPGTESDRGCKGPEASTKASRARHPAPDGKVEDPAYR